MSYLLPFMMKYSLFPEVSGITVFVEAIEKQTPRKAGLWLSTHSHVSTALPVLTQFDLFSPAGCREQPLMCSFAFDSP